MSTHPMSSASIRVMNGEGSRKELQITPVEGIGMKVVQEIVAFILVHYILWMFPIGVMLCFLWNLHPTGGPTLVALTLTAYLVTFFDGSECKDGRPWEYFRSCFAWRLLQSYFPVRAIRTVALDPKKQYIMGWHPHGILVLSRIFCYGGMWELLFEGIDFRVLGATPMFFVPFCRDICLWMRAVDASRKTTEYNLKKGRTLIIYPGGSKEIFETDGSKADTIVYVRTGFVRMALRFGCDLVPVYVYGERKCYFRVPFPESMRLFFLKTLKVPLIVFWGRLFTWLPFRTPQTCVFGAPIPVQKVEDPTDEQVQALHAKYCLALQALYQAHKIEAGYSEKDNLIIK